MPAHRYATLPHSRTDSVGSTAMAEMDDAFESDDDEQHESTPLTRSHPHTTAANSTVIPNAPGMYDFERDYDYPPPGSPPPPSALALPNSYGNSNGSLPSPTSVQKYVSNLRVKGPSFFRRAVGAILPTHYTRIPTEDAPARTAARGGGMENDGVFANVMAKPAPPRTVTVQGENGEIHVMPEETQKDVPPSYSAAQADAAPAYWETTVHAPHIGMDDDMMIDGLPSGSFFSFAWNLLISMSFQFVGFMLTYVLHTTHAAKFGSRAGLGVTLIQYGLYSRGSESDSGLEFGGEGETDGTLADNGGSQAARMIRRGTNLVNARGWLALLSTSPTNGTYDETATDPVGNNEFLGTSMHDWLAFLLMTIGWFLLLSSLLGFVRVKRWESSIRASSNPPPPPSAEAIAHDLLVRQRLNSAFGLDADVFDGEEDDIDDEDAPLGTRHATDGQSDVASRAAAETASVRRSLRAAGLL